MEFKKIIKKSFFLTKKRKKKQKTLLNTLNFTSPFFYIQTIANV